MNETVDDSENSVDAWKSEGLLELQATPTFIPRLVVDKDAIYVVHDDGYIRKWNLVGEMADDFDPIPVSGHP